MKDKNTANRFRGTDIKKKKGVRGHRRIIICGIVFALIVGVFAPSLIFNGGGSITEIKAHAANKDRFEGMDFSAEHAEVQTYIVNGVIELSNVDRILKYSKAYFYKPDFYENKPICLGYTQGSSSEPIPDFIAIGTENHPFKAQVKVISTSASNIKIPEAFFDYVSDSVRFVDSINNLDVNLTFERTTTGNEPVLARHVIHDSNLSTANTWKVTIDKYSSDSSTYNSYSTTGFIGEIDDGVKLNLEITDTTTMNIVNNASGADDVKDVGYVCGIMGEGSSLTVKSITTSTNTGYAVTSANGNAGGVVGSIMEGATLTLNCQMPNPSAAVTASGSNKYAGGIAGQNVSGSLVFGSDFSSSSKYSISNTVSGMAGAGGVFGYYSPAFVSGASSFDIALLQIGTNASTRMKANGTGSIGGLFGVLDNTDSGNITITDSSDNAAVVFIDHNAEDAITDYGGIIGKYMAYDLSSSLDIKDVSVNVARSRGSYTNYGGGIGETAGGTGNSNNAVYVKFDDFQATVASGNNTASSVYGGLVAKSYNSFIDAKDVTLSSTLDFYGGGVIGEMEDGVLRLSGTTNLTGGHAAEAADQGQIVGKRDSSLIFGESGWTLNRSTACKVDDIGSWGEVLRFDGKSTTASTTSETLGGNTVITVDETAHTVEVASHTVSGGATTVSNKADFAKVALCFQLKASENPCLSFNGNWSNCDSIKNVNITLGNSDIDLTGTGLTGFTRDNGSYITYNGKFDGNNRTITLATGKPYGYRGEGSELTSHSAEGNGKIYRHLYTGLFGITDGTYTTPNHTVKNLTIAGTVDINAQAGAFYCGGFAAKAKKSFSADNVTTSLSMSNGGSAALYMGRLVGEMADNIGSINVSNSNFGGTISGNHNNSDGSTYLGGVVGIISHNSDEKREWDFSNVTLSGSVANTYSKSQQKIGGLIAEIAGDYSGNSNHRMLTLDGITVNGLKVSGSSSSDGSMGGLLGYSWLKTDVDVKDVTVKGASEVSIGTAAANTAGLVYRATGRWDVTKIDIQNIKMTASKAKSIGMIVRSGHYYSGNDKTFYSAPNRSAIYLRLPSGYTYNLNLDSGSSINASAVYDELCAYTCPGESDIMKNGNGIISINTVFYTDDGTHASGTYHAQTTYGAKPNPNSRYYYNLDSIDNTIDNSLATVDNSTAKLTTAPKKLMSWGVNVYACANLKQYFADKFNGTITAGNYNMQNFSWYPVTLNSGITLNGTFTLYNKEFEGSEKAKFNNESTNAYWRTSLYDSTNSKNTQHYLMHNALFYNVESCTLNLGTVKLQGNVAGYKKTESGNAATICGALVCGTVSGSDTSHVGTVKTESGGSVSLDGIEIYNDESKVEKAVVVSAYAPLLINKLDSHSALDLGNVSTTTAYNNGTDTKHVATSLVGNAGNSTATDINIEFKKITLDARNATGKTNAALADSSKGNFLAMYNTYNSIFTKATLLNKFSFESNSSGRYDYTWAEDWDSDNNGTLDTAHTGKVTYGKEVGYDKTKYPKTGATSPYYNSQYPEEEFKYVGQTTTSYYTNPINGNDTATPHTDALKSVFLDNFLPYVSEGYDANAKLYQLQVNHNASETQGCGTYNHPYIFSSGKDIEQFALWINTGTFANNTKIKIPTDGIKIEDNNTITYITGTWCGNDAECTFNGTDFVVTISGTAYTIAPNVMRTYLAGAYYQIDSESNLTVESDTFTGFGASDSAEYRFRGVIDGKGKTIINKTGAPFIYYSNGCVVKDLTVTVMPEQSITLAGYMQDFTKMWNPGTTNKSGEAAYGAVIGRVMGGDTIIDNVNVVFNMGDKKIVLRGQYAQYVPVGGYIGVVVNGGVIFRNMSGETTLFSTTGKLANGFIDGDPTKKYPESGTKIIDGTASGNYTVTSDYLGSMAWLYVNPIIGRVINGFAVTEDSAFRPYEDGTRVYHKGEAATQEIKYWDESNQTETTTEPVSLSHVTLQNGNKHYSIADINPSGNKVAISGNAVTVADGQAFFLMSLMINSGMAKNSLGYNQDYFVSRSAAYTQIGETSSDDYEDYAKNDRSVYLDGSTIKTATDKYGYIAQSYVTLSNSATPGKLANNGSLTITLDSNGKDIFLPDGYKGIGNIFQNVDDCRIKIATFTGNNKTVSQNTYYYFYNGDTKYTPHASTYSGLGLINLLTAGGTYNNFYLTGAVKADLISTKDGSSDISGKRPETFDNKSTNKFLSAGMLMGTANANCTFNNVSLKLIDVSGLRSAGGLIGYSNKSTCTFNYNITTNDTNAYNSDKIKVHSKASTGGLIGKIFAGYVKVDMKKHTFNLTEVVCDNCTYRGGDDNDGKDDPPKYYNFGVGGFVGMMRGGATTADLSANYFKNIIIGSEDMKQTVKCLGTNIYTAGVVGIMNKSKGVTIENCTFYNLSVEAIFGAAGLVAFPTTWTPAVATDVHLLSPLGSTIISTENYAGGLIGSSDNRHSNKNGSQAFTFDRCSIDNYIIEGNTAAGGVIGYRGAYGKDVNLSLQNISVTRCTIKSDNAVGALAGILHKPMKGYNIYTKDISFASKTENGSIANCGYICGKIEDDDNSIATNNRVDGTNYKDGLIKLVGFSRQGTITVNKLVGNSTSASDEKLGPGGYVVFADYNGIGGTDNHNDKFTISYSYTADGTENLSPFVTTNPRTDISATQFLTSDGVGYTGTGISYANSVIGAILADTSNKKYSVAESAGAYKSTLISKLNEYGKLSSYSEETSDTAIITGYDFPLLIVDEVFENDCTQFIKAYLQFITNTNFDFAHGYTAVSGDRTAYDIELGSMEWDGSKFVYQAGTYSATAATSQDGSYLEYRKDDGYFNINKKKFDNATPGRFTLMDVKFYDPSDTSASNASKKVVYHVYVPILVKKMLQYDFNTAMLSGTNYRIAPYIDANNNVLIENIGNTVTMLAQWKYHRTLSEWQAALESGDNFLLNFEKKLLLQIPTGAFPSGTKMVLVDATNNNKYYYANSGTTGLIVPPQSGNVYTFDFSKFTDSSSTQFSPTDLNDMFNFNITSAPGAGKFDKVTLGANATKDDYIAAGATVYKNGEYYKPSDSGDWNITLSYKPGSSEGDGKLAENYYISFFTYKSATTTGNIDFYHLDFYDRGTLNNAALPTSKLNDCHTHFLTGSIFNNDIKLEAPNSNPVISVLNNSITADIEATISVIEDQKDTVKPYLSPTQDKVTVYQSLLVMLNKLEIDKQQKGILTEPTLNVTDFTIKSKDKTGNVINTLIADAKDAIETTEAELYEEIIDQNYIELRNNINLKNFLYNSCGDTADGIENYNIVVKANVNMTYNSGIDIQFPTRGSDYKADPDKPIGTIIGASSNISSTSAAAAYSKTSAEAWNSRQYYCTENTNAILILNSDDSTNKYGEFYQLGINEYRFKFNDDDMPDAEMDDDNLHLDDDNNSIIKLNAIYDVSDLITADDAQSMKLTVSIRKKANYADDGKLDIADYITNLQLFTKDGKSFKDADNSSVVSVNETGSTVEYTYTIKAPRNYLTYDPDSKMYQIPITFSVKSGDNFTGQYSNYMINLKAELYTAETPSNASFIDGSRDDDHVIWTNAKIHFNVIQ